jgi:hypothetical protein
MINVMIVCAANVLRITTPNKLLLTGTHKIKLYVYEDVSKFNLQRKIFNYTILYRQYSECNVKSLKHSYSLI